MGKIREKWMKRETFRGEREVGEKLLREKIKLWLIEGEIRELRGMWMKRKRVSKIVEEREVGEKRERDKVK